jgi:sugar phosphate isomerase/epimerase
MARLSINEITTYRWSFEEDVQHYKAMGVDAIAVWRQKLSDFGEEKGLELLAEANLRVSALQWAGGFTGSDGRTFRESIEDAQEAVQLAGDLKSHCLILYSGARAGHTRNHARRLFRNALMELAPVASERKVLLAIEPMHVGCAAEWTFLTELDESLEIMHAVASQSIRLVFDAYHLGQDRDILQRLSDLVPLLALVQLGDARQAPRGEQNRCRLGEGTIPLREMISAFTEAGYDGFYDVELMGEDLENSDYRDLILHSKQFFETLSGIGG